MARAKSGWAKEARSVKCEGMRRTEGKSKRGIMSSRRKPTRNKQAGKMLKSQTLPSSSPRVLLLFSRPHILTHAHKHPHTNAYTHTHTSPPALVHTKPASGDKVQGVKRVVVVDDNGNKVRVVPVRIAWIHEVMPTKLETGRQEVSTQNKVTVHGIALLLSNQGGGGAETCQERKASV